MPQIDSCGCHQIQCNKVGSKAKIRNRYNQVPHLTQDTISEKASRSALSEKGDHKTVCIRNRQDSVKKDKHETQK